MLKEFNGLTNKKIIIGKYSTPDALKTFLIDNILMLKNECFGWILRAINMVSNNHDLSLLHPQNKP